MDTNNNNARKKQKITEAVDNGVDSSIPTNPVVVIPPALSLGNILKEFPDFLFCVLSYIADRVVFNSISFSNRDIYKKSKAILPPWPIYYKLPRFSSLWSWSPCGTRIACSVHNFIEIFDQRRGPLHRWHHIPNDSYYITDLKFSPDGSYLVSVGDDSFIRLWDNVAGNYEQLQEWNMREEFARRFINDVLRFCISACSKYIAISCGSHVFLKDVEKRGKTIKPLMIPFVDGERKIITQTVFSSNGCAIFICCNGMIQIWRPYLDDDDEDRLIILWRETVLNHGFPTTTFSNDNTMVAIHGVNNTNAKLWSIDMDKKCLTHKSEFPGSVRNERLYFTSDDKYIIYQTENGPTFWNIAGAKFTENAIHGLVNGENMIYQPMVMSISPNNRQLVVLDSGDRCITSYFVK